MEEQKLKIKCAPREVLGKKTRFLRRLGITPIHLFGHGIPSLALQCDTPSLQRLLAKAGKTRLISLSVEGSGEPGNVIVREVQQDSFTRQLLHVDFYQVRATEKIKVEVPVVLMGEAPAVKAHGGVVMRGVNTLTVESLPDKIPARIEVDLSPLVELEQAIHVADLKLDPEVSLLNPPDAVVVKIATPAAEKEEKVEKVAVEEVKAEAAPVPEETAEKEK